MSTDLTERLSALRPAPSLEPGERDALLTAILDCERPAARRAPWSPRRRTVAGVSVAVLAAAAAIVVPALVPSSTPVVGHASPAAAAELRRLAVVVEHHRSVTLGRHQYLYIVEDEVQQGLLGIKAPSTKVYGTSITHRQGWTSPSGRLWRRDENTDPIVGHRVDDYVIPPNDEDSPAHFASLPTNVEQLNDYLRSEFGSGSNTDRNVFDQIESILQTGIAPSSLRSAALQVLAGTDHVTVTKHVRDSRGRRAERFTVTYRSQGRQERESIYLDPRDADVLETTSGGFGDSFVDTVRAERAVDSLPPAVRRGASTHR